MELLCNCPLKSEEFLFVGVISLFGLIYNMTSIGDRMVLPICLFLRQNGSLASPRGICFQKDRFAEIWEGQDGSLKTGCLEVIKVFKSLWGQVDMF